MSILGIEPINKYFNEYKHIKTYNKMKGYIYSIRSHQTKDIYIGSTIQTLSMRIASHRREYKRWLKTNTKYCSSFKLIQYEDVYIELIEEINVQSRQELRKLEGECIRKTNCVNKIIAGRTKKEYNLDNRDKINNNHKKQLTCECGSIITQYYLNYHQKSKKHIDLMKLIN